jgi:chromosome segregation ATPase
MNPPLLRTGIDRVQALRVAIFAVLLLVNSCTTTDRGSAHSTADRIMAENSQMKKRIPLIERENDVLMQENLQYKSRLQEATTRIEGLRADLSYLTEKFGAYVTSTEMQIHFLAENYALLEKTSSHQISELSSRYKDLELKRQEEIKQLNAHIISQNSAFIEEKKKLELKAAEIELKLDMREAQLASLKTTHDELLTKLDAVSGRLAEALLQRSQIEKDLETLRAVKAELLERTEQSQ